jgi:twitching motility two-component system response regulator PilH
LLRLWLDALRGPTKMKILIAEDWSAGNHMMKHGLQRIGYEVILARDGIEAIKKAWQECPDVVVSDVVMPRLNGYQVCRLLRDHQSTARIPVILLTSLDQRQDVFWGLKSGADKFITKGGDISAPSPRSTGSSEAPLFGRPRDGGAGSRVPRCRP